MIPANLVSFTSKLFVYSWEVNSLFSTDLLSIFEHFARITMFLVSSKKDRQYSAFVCSELVTLFLCYVIFKSGQI